MKRARIEIIPMIDTIFFLLVFFMITSLTMIRMKAMQIELPKGIPPSTQAALGTAGRPRPLILTVTDTGNYYLGTTRLHVNNLDAAITQQIAASPKSVVVLNLAKSLSTQTLINVMDTVHKLKTPTGDPIPLLIATEPVDKNGRALSGAPALNGSEFTQQ